ncbi:hypothetical protein [Peteryoungia ipomoeae]|uniref:Uncharacterized protein n=1 Tax=Peteryoungia ipomoeae TaxID=1210932 RepID=A0A4S8PA00_9HYPH|nr:hypothetical protein [Peteryoungia ipomoeae]THV24649.1 hypothetical protein FAA97_00070 [Peteryoungia ipomoeae]
MRRFRIKAIVLALFAGLFGFVFYERYWIWRDCIAASQSSCVTPDGSNVTEGGMVWGVIALGFLAAALIAQFGRR